MAKSCRFVSIFCRSKASIISNGLIVLGTVAVLTLYNIYTFKCPCSFRRNFDYGLAAILAPAGLFFLSGILINRSTWDLVSECRLRKCQKLSGASACALMGNIIGRATVAPLTWVFISLLEGRAYACALSESIDPYSLEDIGYEMQSKVAKFPCLLAIGKLAPFWSEIEGKLKHDSQMIAWILMAAVCLMVLLIQCIKRCTCPLSNRQEDFWSQYHSSQNVLFQRTSAVHAHHLAAENVKNFYGFVVLDEEEKGQLAEHQTNSSICSSQWTGIIERSASVVQQAQNMGYVQSGERREGGAQLTASSSSTVVH